MKIHDTHTLANICQVAADRFTDNAKEFRKLINHKPESEFSLLPHGDGARRLAEQFDQQAEEARKFAEIFSASEPFEVEYDEST